MFRVSKLGLDMYRHVIVEDNISWGRVFLEGGNAKSYSSTSCTL